MTDTLDDQIHQLIAELMDAAPPAPTLPELEWGDDRRRANFRSEHGWSWLRRRPAKVASGVAALVAVTLVLALILVVVVPSVSSNRPIAAAAELHKIAEQAGRQAPPPLTSGQWLLTQEHVIFVATVEQIGDTRTPNAQATIPTTVNVWSNNFGQSCVVARSEPAQFASAGNRTAWVAAGLLVTPNGASTVCTVGTVTQPIAGAGVISVSGLTTDPVMLAQELEDGSTGIANLDDQDGAGNAGFNRAAILLFGSTLGATPALRAALYQALAQMPGVRSLGNVTTKTGATGVGFAVASGPAESVIIVDPTTGALLEAQNIDVPSNFTGLGSTFVAPPPTPSIETEGGSYALHILQLDPLGAPTVSPLPAGLNPGPPFGAAGTITATAKVGVTSAQIEALEPQLQSAYGKALVSVSTSVTTDAPVWVYSFNTGAAPVSGYARILKASGLFASVVVQPGS